MSGVELVGLAERLARLSIDLGNIDPDGSSAAYNLLSDASENVDAIADAITALAARLPGDAKDADWERQWREGWAYSYSGWKLYSDDGELQDNSVQPYIDWRRDTPGSIRSKIAQRAKNERELPPAPAAGVGGESNGHD